MTAQNRSTDSARRTGYNICSVCDIGCQVRTLSVDGRVERVVAHDSPALARNICYKGTAAPHIHNHEDRLRVPLKRVGARGEDRWEEISYAQAMDEIAARLQAVVDQYGPEAFATSTSGWNTQTTYGLDRRFMNLLGAPNWISGVALCAGNTAAVNRLTYGWFPMPDIGNASCIVLLGHNPRKHSWTPIYNAIEGARKKGAKTIVVDPRVSEQAARATLHLQIRAGTDAALLLGWAKVIIDEGLYDKDFVRDWCVGFQELSDRVAEYPLERVAEITGVPAEQIAEAARIYASADGAVIPWTPITDQQLDSTSGIRIQTILRAITGNLDVVGGEILHGLRSDWRTESELQLHDAISPEQRAKQLGYEKHPAFTYRTAEILKPHMERVWGQPWVDQVMGCHMANPTEVFRAMADGGSLPDQGVLHPRQQHVALLPEPAPDPPRDDESGPDRRPRDLHDAHRHAGRLRAAGRCLQRAQPHQRLLGLDRSADAVGSGGRCAGAGELVLPVLDGPRPPNEPRGALPLEDGRGADRLSPGAFRAQLRDVPRVDLHGRTGAEVSQVPEDRLCDAVREGGARFVDPRRPGLRPAALPPAGSGADERVPLPRVLRGARGSVLPDRAAQHRRAAAALTRSPTSMCTRKTRIATGWSKTHGRGSKPSTVMSTRGSASRRACVRAISASPTAGGIPRRAATSTSPAPSCRPTPS